MEEKKFDMNTPTKAYEETEASNGKKKNMEENLRTFGKRQNQINLGYASQIAALEHEIKVLKRQNELLAGQLQKNVETQKEMFLKMAEDMDRIRQVVQRIRLDTKLNSNFIAKMAGRTEDENADASNSEEKK